MKRKLLLCVSLVAILVFVLALAIGAEEITVNTITSDTYGTIYQLSADPGLENADQYKSVLKNIVDSGTEQETLCVMTDGTHYYVFPTSYIIVEFLGNNQKGKFQYAVSDINTALAEWDAADEAVTLPQFELTGSWGNTRIDNLVRIEFSKDVLWFDKNHCLLRSANLKEAIMHDDIYYSGNSTSIFRECVALETVRFSTQFTSIGQSMFYNCKAFKGISNWDEIKHNITSFGAEAYYGCESITELDLSATQITSIPNSFARYTTSLGAVILPATCTSIGDSAFRDSALTSINTENITSYASHAFTATTRLESFVIAEGVTTIPVNFAQKATALKTLVIPSTVKTFFGYSFQECTSLQSVEIKASLESIEANAFSSCSALTDVIFRGTVKTLGQNVFNGCSSLEAIVLPDGLTAGGHDMFSGCNKLTTITIPRTMENLCGSHGNCQYAFHGKGNTIIYTGTTDSTFYTEQLYPKYGSKIQIENHCEVYYGGNHEVSGEVQKVFLGQAFASDYKIFTECGRECGTENVIETIGQLIHLKGYATSEMPGSKAMMHSFVVDKSLVARYQEEFADLKFGVLAVGENTSSPFNGNLIDAQGNKAHEKIAMVDFTEKGFDEIEIKIGGLEGYENTNLYFCGFVIGGENVYYIENDAIKTQAETVTYNDVCAILTGTGNEEENENV